MIEFILHVDTHFGQDMFVIIDDKRYPMTYIQSQTWRCVYKGKLKKNARYQYLMRDIDGSFVKDSPKYHYLPQLVVKKCGTVADDEKCWIVEDDFGFRTTASVFETKAFARCLMQQRNTTAMPTLNDGECLLLLNAPGVTAEQTIRMVGEHPILGGWNPKLGLELMPTDKGFWWVKLAVDAYFTHIQYKFVVVDRASGVVDKWEIGDNRRLPFVCDCKVISTTLRIDYDWHGRGVAIPVFSLRSKDDWGVGQFSDLCYMADWAVEHNMQLIQILPINDTTATGTDFDSYPYRANSVHALHPMYMDVLRLGELNDKQLMAKFVSAAKRLNALPIVNYAAVNELKHKYMRALYNQNIDSILVDKELAKYAATNGGWLKDYAAFSCLRDIYHTDDCSCWGEFSVYSKRRIDQFVKSNTLEIYYYYFIQYNLHLQLTDAIDYLHKRGVVIKGDLPIGVGAKSVDTWVQPTLFNLTMQAGAPPDDFSVRGQNWGFPTYRWSEMAKTDYRWWKSRFATMDRYFDAFRIDHILGFFRIWEVPIDSVWGVMGHFSPALPFTIAEIESYGVRFDKDRFTKPYITEQYLRKLLGSDTAHITSQFMNQVDYNRYELKSDFDTQRKITDCFRNNGLLYTEEKLYDALMTICADVLFIEDDNDKGKYHPRISLYDTESYTALTNHEKWCLRRLHDDFFYYRNEQLWREEAMRKLPTLIGETDMLICGEDLGMVPACVTEVMNRLKILSLEVERMPKDINSRFVNVRHTPYLSVCCTGSHDTSTLRMWWEEDKESSQWYYNNILNQQGVAPETLTAELATMIVDNIQSSPSMWTILPWQDYMACDAKRRNRDAYSERINDPSNPGHIWNWRMHISLN